ncbi:MAG: hypothetical protein E7578_05310 [Ruminococcaceae bacterium]|nr:hypothetical protein [Oscillospiraceae bacterium]
MSIRKLLSMFLSVVMICGAIIVPNNAFVTSTDYTSEELDSSTYDLRKYTDPFWEGNIVYNEVVFPIKNEADQIVPFSLMYDATEIVCVKSYTHDVTYKENVDYILEDGKLVILPTGSIPTVDYKYIHRDSASPGYTSSDIYPYYPRADKTGYEYWLEDATFSRLSLSVTYIHNDTWEAPVPTSQESKLPGTFEKLKNDEALTIVVIGDSVAGGAMSSKYAGIYPYAPAYPEMTLNGLREKYSNDDIVLINSAVGGSMSTFDQAKVDKSIISYSPDLVIVNFGMNDSSAGRVGISNEEFRNNIVNHINYVQSKLPNCEFLLLSSLYGNRYTFPASSYEGHANVLCDIAEDYDGVGVANPLAIEKHMIEERGIDYICFTADNMVHPGDFGMRLYTQSILEALSMSDLSEYRELLISQLTDYADPDNRSTEKKEDLISLINETEVKMSNARDEWDLNEIVDTAYTAVDEILSTCYEHKFKDIVVAPGCKEMGFTASVCNDCGYISTHSYVPALGLEHIMDNGVQTISPTYKTAGEITYSCARCTYTEKGVIPVLTNPPTVSGKGMMHISDSYNYMAAMDIQPYLSGAGYVEFDICPLTIEKYNGVPYIGVWFTSYNITACYNFKDQQVQIVQNDLPFYGTPTVYASADYSWTSSGGEYEYNWKKFAVELNGSIVKIYIDGELILEDTKSFYSATTEVPLIYTTGECYMDNVKVASGNYDPVTGSGGNVLGFWNLDSASNVSALKSAWGQSLATTKYVSANAENITTASYVHTHSGELINTVAPGCSSKGYDEYLCSHCGEVYRTNDTDPLQNGHSLINRSVSVYPTLYAEGEYTYECVNCDLTFTEMIPIGTIIDDIEFGKGDVNGDGDINSTDLVLLRRYIAGASVNITKDAADVNGDGSVSSEDIISLSRSLIA